MPRLALALLALLGVGVQAELEVVWPEHGSIKASIPKSPAEVNFDLPGCLSISVNWKNDQVSVQKHGESKPVILNGTHNMREEGGQLVVLLTLEAGQAFIIANVETTDGSLSARTVSLPMQKCPISKLRITSPDSGEIKGVIVAVSEEIYDMYMRSANST